MNVYADYYPEKLYPLQDGVLKIMRALNTPFYLTGGTALSRGYFNHRYSDDLDFFVNDADLFQKHLAVIVENLDKYPKQFNLQKNKTIAAKDFFQIFVADSNADLKLDFVNDIALHYGELVINENLGKIDSLENILTNKISALFRYEPKDIADIWIISKNFKFNWEDIITKASAKELGIDPVIAGEIIAAFPEDRLEYIKWMTPVDKKKIMLELKVISGDILRGKNNSILAV
ncbi:MAG: hypothetical protein A2096_05275 [Spirochaetes bacterium GWF1_41_5]|nr:MAG: hypothetical protein A2096_05275 [Spirochaetes bacterium GWF1_41_5]